MTHRILTHLRHNTIAYVALFFALGGGGAGAAIAATTVSSKTIHACVSKKNGAVYVVKRCTKTTKAVSWNEVGPRGLTGRTGATGASGSTPFSANGVVGTNGVAGANSQGFSVQPVATGEYQVTLTGAGCAVAGGQGDSLVVSPFGSPGDEPYGTAGYTSAYYVTQVDSVAPSPGVFDVYTGEVTNGSYASANDAFTVLGSC